MGLQAMPSLVFVIDTLSKGGAENVLLQYVESLSGRYAIKVMVLKHIADYRLPEHAEIEFVLSPEQKLTENGFLILHKLTEAAKAADLIIGFSDFWVNYVCVLAAKLAQKPVLLSVRNELSRELERFDLPAINRELVHFCYQHADKIVCVSDAGKADLVQAFAIPAAKIQRLPNPVDLQKFAQNHLPPQGLEPFFAAGPVILVIARLVKQKNLAFIVRLFAKLKADARLCIVGKGPEYESLRALTEHLGIAGKVCFPGYRDDIPALLQHAALLLTASHYEGQPNAVLEAMAAGTLVVAPKIPAIRELITSGYNGLLFEKDDEADAIRCIEQAFANAGHTRNLVNNAGNTVTPHDSHHASLALAEVIESIIGKTK
ncbi:MAG: hypothetical protein CTY29_06360 [Methylobacter sp.]|nr:MAG: hypothetical protein CTY29_06360 [Methylobacter sp.]